MRQQRQRGTVIETEEKQALTQWRVLRYFVYSHIDMCFHLLPALEKAQNNILSSRTVSTNPAYLLIQQWFFFLCLSIALRSGSLRLIFSLDGLLVVAMLLTVIPQGNFNKLSISSLNPLSLTVDPFSPGGPGWPISPLSPWAYMSTTFSLHGHLVSNLLQWITMERTSYFTFSPASPVSPTGPMKPTKPWNTHTQCWMDEQIDVWKKINKSGCVRVSYPFSHGSNISRDAGLSLKRQIRYRSFVSNIKSKGKKTYTGIDFNSP